MLPEVLSSSFLKEWETIPKDCLKTHLRFYETSRQNHSALHWGRDRMISTLHSFYCRSSGMVPQNVAELDFFWKTGNIPTRNLHLLQPIPHVQQTQDIDNRCALCNVSFQKNDSIYLLPCGHRFHVSHDPNYHTDSLKTLLRNNNQCPSCSSRVVLTQTER